MNNFKYFRNKKGMSQKFIADYLGITSQAYSNYENSKRQADYETLLKLSELFNTNIEALLSDMPVDEVRKEVYFDISRIPGIIPVPHGKKIPIVGSIACGTPILATENIDGYVDVNPEDHATFALKCVGESMQPKFFDEDVVLIHQQPIVENGQIAAVLIENEATLKRVYLDESKLVLSPENPQFAPLVYQGEEMNDIRILGRAIGFVRYFE